MVWGTIRDFRQLLEQDDEIEIIFEEEKIESWLDSESDFLDSILKLVFIDEGSIKMLEITSSGPPLISSNETSNQY